jgi:hypothetical protein
MKDIELSSPPNDLYRKFFERFSEIKTAPVSSWKTIHILAYFCSEYEKAFGQKYSFKFNHKAPSKCFEVFKINSLAGRLSSDPLLLKDYIDFAILEKKKVMKRKPTTLSFLCEDAFLNKFKWEVLPNKEKGLQLIDRAMKLPDNLKIIVSSIDPKIETYGDLSFLVAAMKANNKMETIQLMLDQMEKEGFDISSLEKIV